MGKLVSSFNFNSNFFVLFLKPTILTNCIASLKQTNKSSTCYGHGLTIPPVSFHLSQLLQQSLIEIERNVIEFVLTAAVTR